MSSGRAPYGARGLKSLAKMLTVDDDSSRPVWGAWIEISSCENSALSVKRRAPYGARGLKLLLGVASLLCTPVAPRMGRVD